MTPGLIDLLPQVDPAIVGRRIRAARELFALSLTDLATAVGTEATVLDDVERGLGEPDLALLVAVADATASSAELLVTGLSGDVLTDLQGDLDLAGLTLSSRDPSGARSASERVLDQLTATGATAPHIDRAARRLRARALEAGGQLAEAIEELLRATAVPVAEVAWVEDLISLSRCYRESGQMAEAIAVGDQTVGAVAELGLADTTEAIQLTVTCACAYIFRGDLGYGTRMCLQAASHAERLGLATARGSALWNASVAKQTAGDLPAALTLATEALGLLEPDGDSRRLGMLRCQIANIHLDLEGTDPRVTLDLLGIASQELDWSGAGAVELARHRLNTARAHHALGEDGRAEEVLDESEQLAPADAIDVRAWQYTLRARIAVRRRDFDGALASLHAAARLLTSGGTDGDVAQAWFRLGDAFEALDEHAHAADAFHRACIAQGLRSRH